MTQLTLPLNKKQTTGLVLQALSEWRTIPEVRDFVYKNGGRFMSETGMSARMRELRSQKFGALVVKSQVRSGRTWEYRLGQS